MELHEYTIDELFDEIRRRTQSWGWEPSRTTVVPGFMTCSQCGVQFNGTHICYLGPTSCAVLS